MSDESKSNASIEIDIGPAEPSATPALEAAAPPAPAPEPTVVATPAFANPYPAARPRFLLGPSLWVGGVLMWAYVVMGIFTTTRFGPKRIPLGEGAAAFWVMVATGTAGYLAVRRSLAVTGGGAVVSRAGGIALGAILAWMLLLISAMVVGGVAGDGPVTLLLSLGSAAVVWRGRILTNRGAPISEAPRLFPTACWIGAALITAFALLVR